MSILLSLAPIVGHTMDFIPLNDSHSKTSFYLALEPRQEAKGMLVLMPGFGQIPQMVFPETQIPNIAYANNILTITVAGGDKIYVDDTVNQHLSRTMVDALKRYNIPKNKVVIGGFSAGGTIALGYAEKCMENPEESIQPTAVFTVDSPVDLFEFWRYMEREIEKAELIISEQAGKQFNGQRHPHSWSIVYPMGERMY